jgi:hypothetical protein
LAKCILSTPTTPPPGIPESWKRHKEMSGRFEVWLPEEWEDPGDIRTIMRSLRDVVEGDESPVLFVAFSSRGPCFESIIVESYDRAFDVHAPFVWEELAREFVRLNPVILTDEAGRNVFPEPSTDIVTMEQDENKAVIAYQGYVLKQDLNEDFVRTIACVVTRSHVYGIHLDTIEESGSTSISTYERVLKTFQALQ